MHELIEAMANMNEEEALQIVDDLLAKGEDPQKILDLSSEAMQVIGQRYQEGTYFLPELIMSGEMLRKMGEILKPRLAEKSGSARNWAPSSSAPCGATSTISARISWASCWK